MSLVGWGALPPIFPGWNISSLGWETTLTLAQVLECPKAFSSNEMTIGPSRRESGHTGGGQAICISAQQHSSFIFPTVYLMPLRSLPVSGQFAFGVKDKLS